jgi:hypothetical protein
MDWTVVVIDKMGDVTFEKCKDKASAGKVAANFLKNESAPVWSGAFSPENQLEFQGQKVRNA